MNHWKSYRTGINMESKALKRDSQTFNNRGNDALNQLELTFLARIPLKIKVNKNKPNQLSKLKKIILKEEL